MNDVEEWNSKIIEEFLANEGKVVDRSLAPQCCSFTPQGPRPATNGCTR